MDPPSGTAAGSGPLPPEAIALATRMYNAAREGDMAIFEQALPAGLPANMTNEKGDTLLMLAAYHGHADLVKLLIRHGADPNRLNDRGQSPLAGAVFKAEDAVVEVRLQSDIARSWGRPLMGPKALLEGGADPDYGAPSALESIVLFKQEEKWRSKFESAPGRGRILESAATVMTSTESIKTRFIIFSDTDGVGLGRGFNLIADESYDVAIHCGNMTLESKLREFEDVLWHLEQVNAPLKLVIAGDQDWTLAEPDPALGEYVFDPEEDDRSVNKERGAEGEAEKLMLEAAQHGIIYLREGTHHFHLDNGAYLKVYASPFVPKVDNGTTDMWDFEYRRKDGHRFDIEPGTDVVITHGPPRGILDWEFGTYNYESKGCRDLYKAIRRARPQLHCFGHIWDSWGGMKARWLDQPEVEAMSPWEDMDKCFSDHVDSMNRSDDEILNVACPRWLNTNDPEQQFKIGHETYFVNACLRHNTNLPWIADLELPVAGGEDGLQDKVTEALDPKDEWVLTPDTERLEMEMENKE